MFADRRSFLILTLAGLCAGGCTSPTRPAPADPARLIAEAQVEALPEEEPRPPSRTTWGDRPMAKRGIIIGLAVLAAAGLVILGLGAAAGAVLNYH